MAKYKSKPVVIEATQWFKNGDHPEDDVWRHFEISGESPREPREGKIVRYFRNPYIPGTSLCKGVDRKNKPIGCGRMFHDHGWIDTLEGGHTVCPGDWIIKGLLGEFYPCKPEVFDRKYEPAE